MRVLETVLRNICHARAVTIDTFCDGWLFALSQGDNKRFVFGYHFDLNSGAAQSIADDKVATYQILSAYNVPAVEHLIVYASSLEHFASERGEWRRALDSFRGWGRDVVCKPISSSGGKSVRRARTERELEAAVTLMLRTSHACCLSPFIDAPSEIRVIMLNSLPLLSYKKQRLEIVGDGRSSIGDLLLQLLKSRPSQPHNSVSLDAPGMDLLDVPALGSIVLVEWRHNLALGARPTVVDLASPEARPAVQLANQAMTALGLSFASVDILVTPPPQQRHIVIEVNAGVMMEHFYAGGALERSIVHNVYDHALTAMGFTSPESAP